jgi:polyisoprenoid-binding protein YceI
MTTICAMALAQGSHSLDQSAGTLQVKTYREGVAARVGHDLVIDVAKWSATVEVGADGAISAIALHADPRSLAVREGLRGVKPLSDRDRADIARTIDEKILRGAAIELRTTGCEAAPAGVTSIRGELTLAGATRPVAFKLAAGADGRVSATVPVVQSQWGIKPYRGLMGALKVRDDIEVVVDARLPVA